MAPIRPVVLPQDCVFLTASLGCPAVHSSSHLQLVVVVSSYCTPTLEFTILQVQEPLVHSPNDPCSIAPTLLGTHHANDGLLRQHDIRNHSRPSSSSSSSSSMTSATQYLPCNMFSTRSHSLGAERTEVVGVPSYSTYALMSGPPVAPVRRVHRKRVHAVSIARERGESVWCQPSQERNIWSSVGHPKLSDSNGEKLTYLVARSYEHN